MSLYASGTVAATKAGRGLYMEISIRSGGRNRMSALESRQGQREDACPMGKDWQFQALDNALIPSAPHTWTGELHGDKSMGLSLSYLQSMNP